MRAAPQAAVAEAARADEVSQWQIPATFYWSTTTPIFSS